MKKYNVEYEIVVKGFLTFEAETPEEAEEILETKWEEDGAKDFLDAAYDYELNDFYTSNYK